MRQVSLCLRRLCYRMHRFLFVIRDYTHTPIIPSAQALHTVQPTPGPETMLSPVPCARTCPPRISDRWKASVRDSSGRSEVRDVSDADAQQSIHNRNISRWRIPLFKQHNPFPSTYSSFSSISPLIAFVTYTLPILVPSHIY